MKLRQQNGIAGLPCRATLSAKNPWDEYMRQERECHKIMFRHTSGLISLRLKDSFLQMFILPLILVSHIRLLLLPFKDSSLHKIVGIKLLKKLRLTK